MSVGELLRANHLTGDYPDDWADFIGQDHAKRMLLIACRSAALRGAPLEHVLLAAGEAGVGKTTLALLIANELGTGLRIVSGRMDTNEARITLATMQPRDVLFIDEIHRLVDGGKKNAEWLLHLMTDGVLMGPTGAEKQPAITIIGATTDVGRLPDTIVSRFGIRPTLHPYTLDEAMVIACKMAERILPGDLPFPDLDTLRRIAIAANRNPRTISSIIKHLRDIELVSPGSITDGESYDLSEALSWMGLTPDGLTDLAVRYLDVLVNEFNGQAGERTLADRLQEPGGLRATERLLLEHELIRKTARGRVVTQAGIKRAMEVAAA